MADVCGDDGAAKSPQAHRSQGESNPGPQAIVFTRKGKHFMSILNNFLEDQMMKRKLRNGHTRKHLRKAFRKIHAKFVKKLERKFSTKDMAIATSRWTFRPRKKGPSAVQRPNSRTLTSVHHDGILEEHWAMIAGEQVGDHSSCVTATKEVPCLSASYDHVGCCSVDRTIQPSFSSCSLRPENETSASSLSGKLVQYPENPGEADCRYYMKFGECKHLAFCKYNHPKPMLNLCMNDQTEVLENQSGLPSAVDKARPHTINHLASASSSMISEEAEGESRDQVFVCICGEKLLCHMDFNRTTVKELVVSALKRRGIKYCDIYMTLCGKVLKGEQILSSIPIYPGTHIHVKPRTRGGMLRSIPLDYVRLDHYINRAGGLFDHVQLPQNLCKANMTNSGSFLNDFSRFVIHELLVCVFRDGHQGGRCWWGAFELKDILIGNGNVRISPDIRQHDYSPDGSRLDYLKLWSILSTVFYDHDFGRLPCHMSHLLLLLYTSSEVLRQDERFITFLINHPCLLSSAEKVTRYVQLDHVITNLGPHDRHIFRCLCIKSGWFPEWISKIFGIPDLWGTYMYNPVTNPDGSQRSRFTCTLDDCSHMARNFLSHFLRTVSLKEAEAAVSWYLEYLLPNIMMIMLSHTGPGHWDADLLQIFSNTNSDRSVARVP